jgi:hypothetical protein
MILVFGFGMVTAALSLYFVMCRPEEREIYQIGYDAGYLDAMQDQEDKKDADSFV